MGSHTLVVTLSNAGVTVGMQISDVVILFPLDIYPEEELLDQIVVIFFNFLRNTILFS